MNIEEHKARHVLLHNMLDELVADWIDHNIDIKNGKTLSQTSIMEIMQWSDEQTKNPTEKE